MRISDWSSDVCSSDLALWLLYERQKGNLNMRGAFWHIVQTFVGSFLIIVSALVLRFTGFLAIDPLLGMAFGLVLLWASRSEERRVGKEGVSTCRSRCSRYHKKKKIHNQKKHQK